MKLKVFTGGLSTRLLPQYIKDNEGEVYENVDNAAGALVPVKDKVKTSIQTNLYTIKFFGEWISFTYPVDSIEFQGVLYYTDRFNTPKKYDGTNTYNLGIAQPVNAPTISIDDKAEPFETIGTSVSDAGDLPNVNTKYLLFNVVNDRYSQPLRVTVNADYVGTPGETKLIDFVKNKNYREYSDYYDMTISDSRNIIFKNIVGKLGNSAKLFRLYNNKWYLVHEFTTVTESFDDNTYDISGNEELDETKVSKFNGTYQYVYTYYNSNDGTESRPSDLSEELKADSGYISLSDLTTSSDPQVTHKRIYRVGRDLTQFTLVDEVLNSETAFVDDLSDVEVDGRLLESDNYSQAPAGLKYLTEAYGMLFGALGTTLRFTPINKPNAWPEEFSIEYRREITGLGPVANGILVMTRRSTRIVTGTGPTLLSSQTLRGDQGCISFDSIEEIAEGMIMWASEDGLCTSSGNNVKLITQDKLGKLKLKPFNAVVHDEVYYLLEDDGSILAFDYRFNPTFKRLNLDVQNIVVEDNVLYGWHNGYLYKLFQSTSSIPLKYRSAIFDEGRFTLSKTYKKFYFTTTGSLNVKIYIDDYLVFDGQLSGENAEVIQPRVEDQRGHYIQFEIEGIGTVKEIFYTAEAQDR